jgi:8-oxo-dGTP pyrophosphatase MutT (NUDIX family)
MSAVRLAATVILARSGPRFEIYLARRSARSAFAPDAFVFPGGTIDAADAAPQMQSRTLGLDDARVAREFRATISSDLHSSEPVVKREEARSLLVAGLRELYEEAGVLLGRTARGQPIDAGALEHERTVTERELIYSGQMTFADFLTAHDWYADAGALTLFSHWITPPSEPRRYNTHFFFAVAPEGQAALADADEMHDGLWIAPTQALERYRTGTMHLVYPTIKHLERLAQFEGIDANESIESALNFAKSKPIVTIMPADAGEDFAIPTKLEGAW